MLLILCSFCHEIELWWLFTYCDEQLCCLFTCCEDQLRGLFACCDKQLCWQFSCDDLLPVVVCVVTALVLYILHSGWRFGWLAAPRWPGRADVGDCGGVVRRSLIVRPASPAPDTRSACWHSAAWPSAATPPAAAAVASSASAATSATAAAATWAATIHWG